MRENPAGVVWGVSVSVKSHAAARTRGAPPTHHVAPSLQVGPVTPRLGTGERARRSMIMRSAQSPIFGNSLSSLLRYTESAPSFTAATTASECAQPGLPE